MREDVVVEMYADKEETKRTSCLYHCRLSSPSWDQRRRSRSWQRSEAAVLSERRCHQRGPCGHVRRTCESESLLQGVRLVVCSSFRQKWVISRASVTGGMGYRLTLWMMLWKLSDA